ELLNHVKRLLVLFVKLVLADIAGIAELEQHFEVVELLINLFIRVGPNLFGAYVLQKCFRLFGVIPEIGLLGDALFVFYLGTLAIVVKDTSSRRRYDLL